MYEYTAGSCSGSPHSSHSVTVSGSDGSRIEFSASTNGTCATIPAKAPGARLATAPISSPPAHPPPPRRPAPGDQPGGRRPAGRHEVLGAGHEVAERVLLLQHLPVVVPRP